VKGTGCTVYDTWLTLPFRPPNNIFRSATEELCNVAAQYATSDEMTEVCPTPGSREATPSSCKETLSDVTVHDAKEGTKDGKKRCKQCPQRVIAMADFDSSSEKKIGSSGTGCLVTAAHSSKWQERSPTDHFESLQEEARVGAHKTSIFCANMSSKCME
jgi:hypothetical protein